VGEKRSSNVMCSVWALRIKKVHYLKGIVEHHSVAVRTQRFVTQQPTTAISWFMVDGAELGGIGQATKPAGPVFSSIVETALLSRQWGKHRYKRGQSKLTIGTKYLEGVGCSFKVGFGFWRWQSRVLFPKEFTKLIILG